MRNDSSSCQVIFDGKKKSMRPHPITKSYKQADGHRHRKHQSP